MKKIIVSLCLLIPVLSFAQKELKGIIMAKEDLKDTIGVYGVNVYWLGTSLGTVTDERGRFQIPYKTEYKRLVVSFVGYKTDTLTIMNSGPIRHFLTPEGQLDEVVIINKRKAIQKSFLKTQNTFTVNKDELLKAACCNLSESFETNPSIDVSFSDALTGTKRIQMLGLTSPYLLFNQENIPSIRGASQAFGLTFTPGTWVESIQITKGAGSVVNGYESISGQINAELVKPFSDDRLFVNAYASLNGRFELNTHINQSVSEKWQTGFYIHGNYRGAKIDANQDNFLDVPLSNQINVMNRWQYTDAENGWISFLNVRYLTDTKQMGEINYDPTRDKGSSNVWGSEIATKRFESSAKLGYVFPQMPFQSFGLQLAYSNHKQDSYFGLNLYDIEHESFYGTFLFNSIIGDSRNKFKTGISASQDAYVEEMNQLNYNRTENAVGAFFEYAYDNLDDFSFTAGVRVDKHTYLGTFVTPRLHVRYAPWTDAVLRASVGRGRRNAAIFAENQIYLASSRQIAIQGDGENAYGLSPEIAWNFGFSYLQKFRLFERNGDVTVDFYRTDFSNQVVVDLENPQEVSFYNLEGESKADSFQIEVNYEVVDRLSVRKAYKYYDVFTAYTSGVFQKPLQAKHRFFANISYETEATIDDKQWKFDVTYNFIGEQRLPATTSNPVAYQLPVHTKPYSLLNSQITRVFSQNFETYIGAENLTNYKQKNPIVGSDAPFGPYFDTTMVYAPVFGRMLYLGLRFKLD